MERTRLTMVDTMSRQVGARPAAAPGCSGPLLLRGRRSASPVLIRNGFRTGPLPAPAGTRRKEPPCPQIQLTACHAIAEGSGNEMFPLLDKLVTAARTEPGNLAFDRGVAGGIPHPDRGGPLCQHVPWPASQTAIPTDAFAGCLRLTATHGPALLSVNVRPGAGSQRVLHLRGRCARLVRPQRCVAAGCS
jgi:hypothetical protein